MLSNSQSSHLAVSSCCMHGCGLECGLECRNISVQSRLITMYTVDASAEMEITSIQGNTAPDKELTQG
jgi:hypothetical protein